MPFPSLVVAMFSIVRSIGRLRPTAIAAVLVLTVLLPARAVGSSHASSHLPVRVRVSPSGIFRTSVLTVKIKTRPSARCTLFVAARAGHLRLSSLSTSRRGFVLIGWRIPARAPSGRWTFTATCRRGHASGQVTVRHVVRARGRSGAGAAPSSAPSSAPSLVVPGTLVVVQPQSASSDCSGGYIATAHWAYDASPDYLNAEDLLVQPTFCGRIFGVDDPAGAFSEAIAKAGGALNRSTLYDQFLCHAVYAPFKSYFDLEPWREDLNLPGETVFGCNPPPVGPVYGVGIGSAIPSATENAFAQQLIAGGNSPAMGEPHTSVIPWGLGCVQFYFEGTRGPSAILSAGCSAGETYWVGDYFFSYYDAYQASAWQVVGFPSDDSHRWGPGWAQHFAGGQFGANILLRADGRSDVHDVHGAIGSAYMALGGAPGVLGYPVTDQYAWCGVTRQDFLGGSIGWDPADGARPITGQPCNRYGNVSYDRVAANAPYHGYFNNAWQGFVAQSDALTYIGALAGNPTLVPGSTTSTTMTIRLCSAQPDVNGTCFGQLAQVSVPIVNYGITAADIGDIAVTPGQEYWIVWYQPQPANGKSWVTYWWSGGPSISQSDQMVGLVEGYNR